jgi:tryptophan synthase alpha subunit
VKKNSAKPFVVGFGIKSKVQISHIVQTADGAVVGSALLQMLEGKTTIDETVSAASHFFSSLM